MIQPDSQPESNLSTAQSDSQQEANLLTPTNFGKFWHSFRLFPFRFGEYAFTHWYLFTIGLLGVLLILDLSSDLMSGLAFHHDSLYNFLHNFHNTATYRELTDWIYIAGVVAVSLIALTFNGWRSSIPTTFQELLSRGRISSIHENGDLNSEYYSFLEKYQKTLLSKKRYIFFGAIFIICLVFTWGYIQFLYELFQYYGSVIAGSPLAGIAGIMSTIADVIRTPLAVFLEGYFFVAGSWVLGVTGRYLKALTLQFKFHIQPSHPDHCGGLRTLGNFSFGIALPILILVFLLGLYALVGLTPLGAHILEPILATILLPFISLLAAIAFFVPLWDIHRKMVDGRKEYEDDFATRAAKLEQIIRSSIDNQESVDNQALKKVKIAKGEIEVLQLLHPDKVNYPVWPFDHRLLIAFLTPQIPSMLGLLAELKGPLLEIVKHFFSS